MMPPNEANKYILDAIKTWVWSGFYSSTDVDSMIEDILEEDADEAFLRAAILPEFAKKAAAESTWPSTTDCDRLDRAFEALNMQGIIALQNAGYTMSDGLSDVSQVLHERGQNRVRGYCFYHGQDLERAVDGGGLWFAFGDLDNDASAKTEIGRSVKDLLERFGFTVEWNGDPETRLYMPNFDWKRRRAL
jgi:hypothetical protein